MTDTKVERCPTCGTRITTRKESLTKGLIQTLEKFYNYVMGNRTNDVQLGSLGFNPSQYTNFQKLQYFDLVEKKYVGGEWQVGRWAITKKGFDFLQGQPIEKYVMVKQGHGVVSRSDEGISIRFRYTLPTWLTRDDYAAGQQDGLL